QRIEAGQPFAVYVDYAHTEQAFTTVLRFLSQRTHDSGGRLIAVFGAAGNRDRAKRPRLAQIAAEWSDFFIITNEDPFGEDREAIIAEIAGGVPESLDQDSWMIQVDRRQAIADAIDRAQPGDTVVVTGKGHETSIVESGQSIPWSDAGVVRELLGMAGATAP